MLYADLPESKEIVRSRRPGDLTDAISLAIGPATECCGFDVAHNSPSSCRVFLTDSRSGQGVPLDEDCRKPSEIAAELVLYASPRIGFETARLPEVRPDDTEPGWSIRKILVCDRPAVVATAVWVERM